MSLLHSLGASSRNSYQTWHIRFHNILNVTSIVFIDLFYKSASCFVCQLFLFLLEHHHSINSNFQQSSKPILKFIGRFVPFVHLPPHICNPDLEPYIKTCHDCKIRSSFRRRDSCQLFIYWDYHWWWFFALKD